MTRIFRTLGLLGGAWAAFAVETQVWTQGAAVDYEKATLRGLSLRSDGRLTLAPAQRQLLDAATGALWTLARNSRGVIFTAGAGSGSTVRIFRVEPSGQSSVWSEVDGLEIHALAIDAQDQVFAATSPDGQVWRLSPDGKATPFYDPKAKYIWAMAFAPNGELLVATGDRGEVHRVTPGGQGRVWYRLDDAHARSLAVGPEGQALIGSEPSGLIVRVTEAGEGFVLHQSAKREVTALAVKPDGTIYAAAAGTKVTPQLPPLPALAPPPPPAAAGPNPPRPATGGAPPPPTPPAGSAVSGGSEVIAIRPDGEPAVIWTHPQEVAYSLALDESGLPWVGTGNKGSLYRIDSAVLSTHLRSVAPGQITGLLAAGRAIFAVTANVGKLYALGPERETSGAAESDILDAGRFSRWGRLNASTAGTGQVAFETRSGNLDRPQSSWSPWTPLNSGRVASPPARFLQWRALLTAPATGPGPELSGVDVAWLSKNVAPRVEQVEATPLNYRFPSPASVLAAAPASLTLAPLGRRTARSGAVPLDTSASSAVTLTYSKGSAGLRWLAQDDNGDRLSFKVELRGVTESTWKLLRERVPERYLTFDATAFPDGEYVARVTASDAPDNPPGQALASSLESPAFLIDNTAPVIADLAGQPAGGRIQLRFRATDELSWIAKAEYSVNGVEWLVVEPTTLLSDARDLAYDWLIDRPAPGEVTIAIRVTDTEDNQRLAKVVVR